MGGVRGTVQGGEGGREAGGKRKQEESELE